MDYQQLIKKVDEEYEKLLKIFAHHIVCKRGCSSCCMSIRIFPIEYFSIAEKIKTIPRIPNLKNEDADACAFLDTEGACNIYEHRPLLCRTHGLPLLHMNLEGTDWEVALCELNFQSYEGDFNVDNTYHEDTWNSELYMMNQAFISTMPAEEFDANDMLELDNLY